MYPSKIKLSNINNLSDARFAAAVGIDYIGFCFDADDASYIPPVKAKEIFEWTSGINIVAEFGEQRIDEIKDILKTKSQKFKKDELINKLTSEFNKFKDFGIDLNDANKTANKANLTTKKAYNTVKKGEQDLYDFTKEERDTQRNEAKEKIRFSAHTIKYILLQILDILPSGNTPG
jgi:hypothetical protein